MAWSVTIGRFGGTNVRIHVTLLLFLAWIGANAWVQAGPAAALTSVVFIALVFSCVVLHEFGHIVAARQFGVDTPDVTLLPIGGIANMRRLPTKPGQELIVALAGPLVNVVIGLALLAALGSVGGGPGLDIADPGVSLPLRLAQTNLLLAAFNLIPAFPMDGGRVLHAVLSIWMDGAKATAVAATIGQALAIAFGFLGLFGNPMLLLIAIFIYVAAAGEAQMTLLQQSLRGLRVADVMEREFRVFGLQATLEQAVDALIATAQADFPVVDDEGKPRGLVSRLDITEALKSRDGPGLVASFLRGPVEGVSASMPMDDALTRLQESAARSLCVVDAQGTIIGVLPRQTLTDVLLIRTARPDWRFRRPT